MEGHTPRKSVEREKGEKDAIGAVWRGGYAIYRQSWINDEGTMGAFKQSVVPAIIKKFLADAFVLSGSSRRCRR